MRLATLRLAGAAAFTALSGPALAGWCRRGGDFDVVPLFRALASGTVDFGDRGGAINRIDQASNVAALSLATGNGTISTDDATL